MINDNDEFTAKIDVMVAHLKSQNIQLDVLLRLLAERQVWVEHLIKQDAERAAKGASICDGMEVALIAFLEGDASIKACAENGNKFAASLIEIASQTRKQQSTKAAQSLHSQPGGSRDKQDKIRELWATGKYKSRTDCALKECSQIGMSYDAARKALRNTPQPH